jgi:two-component sensor histidine kinase
LRTFEDEMHADELALLALVVTELVTNSVLHGTSDAVEVELGVGDGVLHGAVLDHGDGFVPAQPSPGAPNARKGLGLAMVERASARWGTSDEGRRVWFELRLGAAADWPARPARP